MMINKLHHRNSSPLSTEKRRSQAGSTLSLGLTCPSPPRNLAVDRPPHDPPGSGSESRRLGFGLRLKTTRTYVETDSDSDPSFGSLSSRHRHDAAPSRRSASTTSWCLLSVAMARAVSPSLATRFTSARIWTSASTAAACPTCAAKPRGVQQYLAIYSDV